MVILISQDTSAVGLLVYSYINIMAYIMVISHWIHLL